MILYIVSDLARKSNKLYLKVLKTETYTRIGQGLDQDQTNQQTNLLIYISMQSKPLGTKYSKFAHIIARKG